MDSLVSAHHESGLIRLVVPGLLEYRDIAIRVVQSGTRLLQPITGQDTRVLDDEFITQVVSAVSEAFNNLAIHGYRAQSGGSIELALSAEPDFLKLCIVDWAPPFDPANYADPPEELPERGMGLFIIRSFMDSLVYRAGPPNELTLKKRWRSP